MLKILRKKGTLKAIMWVLAIILIPAFVLWGAGSLIRSRLSQGYAGKIFNRRVSLEDYLKSWEAARDQALMIYGRLFEQVVQYLDLDTQAWDRLILLREAKRQRIRVADEELVERIKNFPLFQKEGRFDSQIYEWVLKYYFRTTPIRFEEQLRDSLKISKLIEKIYSQVSLTEAELKNEFVKANEKARFSYLIIETKDFLSEVEAKDEEELIQFYEKNKELFRKPDTVKVKYLLIDIAKLEKQLSISEEEIREYFQTHPEEFKQTQSSEENQAEENQTSSVELTEEIKERIRSRLLRDKAKDKAEFLKEEINQAITPEVKLEDIAKKYNLIFKETKFFSFNEPLPEIGWSLAFYNTAFGLEVGEVSEPIETPRGYVFLKVKEKRPSFIPEFNEVKVELREALKKEKAKKLAQEKANLIIEKLKELTLEDVAKGFSLDIKQTDLITREGYIPGIGKIEALKKIGFSLSPGETTPEAIESERGFVILRLDEKTLPSDEEFQKEKDKFRKRLLTQKQTEYFNQWFDALKKKANLVSNIERLKQMRGKLK